MTSAAGPTCILSLCSFWSAAQILGEACLKYAMLVQEQATDRLRQNTKTPADEQVENYGGVNPERRLGYDDW